MDRQLQLPVLMNHAPRSASRDYTELLSFARAVAHRYAGRLGSSDAQDLVSAGYAGLADAIRLHGSSPDFDVLARCRIRGAIRDELRKNDSVSRRTRRRIREVTRVEKQLVQQRGAAPTEAELARSAGISESALRELRARSAAKPVSYEALQADHPSAEPVTRPSLSPEALVDKRHKVALLESALPLLSERERLVLLAIYIEGRSLKEIGADLSVTEARVCQIHTAALKKIRDAVGN